MARSKPISVKIATAKVITALENRLAELEANYKTQDENEAKFQTQIDAWKKELFAFAIANVSKAENLRTNYRQWNNNLNVDFDLTVKEGEFPAEPERKFEQIHVHTYREQKEEMENAIRILKMTDEETVSTSTYNAIARYL
jgi:polyhydroxyalkanoate synthesis regulator phasin